MLKIRLTIFTLAALLISSCSSAPKKLKADKKNIKEVPLYSFYKGKKYPAKTNVYGTLGIESVMHIKTGNITLPPLMISHDGKMKYLVGAGIDKTILSDDIHVRGLGKLTIMNATIKSPNIRSQLPGTQITFINVKVIGRVKTDVYEADRNAKRTGIKFILSEFDSEQSLNKLEENKGSKFPIIIDSSVLIKNNKPSVYPSVRGTKPKDFDPSHRVSENHRSLIPGGPDGAQYFVFGKKAADQKAVEFYRKLAIEETKKEHYLVANKYIRKAKAEMYYRPHKELDQLFDDNWQKAAQKWTCGSTRVGYDKENTLTSKSFTTMRKLRAPTFKVNPKNAKLGHYKARCLIKYKPKEDYFFTQKDNVKILSQKPRYEETARSRRARREAEKKARIQQQEQEAALINAQFDAQMAKFGAISDRLTQQTKFNYENRNKIETRATGTYLNINNKKFKYKGNQNYQAALDNLEKVSQQQALQASRDSGRELRFVGTEVNATYDYKYTGVTEGNVELVYDGTSKNINLPRFTKGTSLSCTEDFYKPKGNRGTTWHRQKEKACQQAHKITRYTFTDMSIPKSVLDKIEKFMMQSYEKLNKEVKALAEKDTVESRLEAYYVANDFHLDKPANVDLNRDFKLLKSYK